MEETFTSKFSGNAIMEFYKSTIAPKTRQEARIKVGCEFSPFPVRDGVRLVAMIQSSPVSEETFALRDKLAKACLLRVPVEYQMDGKVMARLTTLTDVGQFIETDPAIIENPILYSLLLDITTAHVLMRFTAPPKETPATEAEAQVTQ